MGSSPGFAGWPNEGVGFPSNLMSIDTSSNGVGSALHRLVPNSSRAHPRGALIETGV